MLGQILGMTWPEAGVAIAVIAMVGGLVLVVVWQLLAMARDRARHDATVDSAEAADSTDSRR